MTKWDRAKTTAETVNQWAITAAVVVGGFWALYKYVLVDSPSAQLELNQVSRICAERGSLDIRVDAVNDGTNVFGNVVAKNIGTRIVNLDMGDTPVNIAEMDLAGGGPSAALFHTSVAIPIADGSRGLGGTPKFSLLPGRTLNLHFAVHVPRPGAYVITFVGGPRETDPTDDVCGPHTDDVPQFEWAATTILDVKAAPAAAGANH